MSMKPFITDNGTHVHVFPITITMGTSAHMRAVIFSTTVGTYGKEYNLEGADYANWGANDDYIKEYICDKEGFIGRPVSNNEVIGNPNTNQ